MQGWPRVSSSKTKKVRVKRVESGQEEGQVDGPGRERSTCGGGRVASRPDARAPMTGEAEM